MSPDITETVQAHDDEEPPSFEVNLTIHDERWKTALSDICLIAKNAVQNLLKAEQSIANNTVAVVLTNDDEIHQMNRDFRQIDKPTNVLSFPDGEEGALGDIVLSLDTLQREADEQKKNLSHHVVHMLTHGVLHLLGHDHEEDEEAAIMEAREIAFLKTLNISNPYSEV